MGVRIYHILLLLLMLPLLLSWHQVRKLVGPEGQVIGAVSGGVDSSVAAVLLQKAIGDRFHAVLVDNGLLRKNEAVDVVKRLKVCWCFVCVRV